ncbi:flagellar hook-basal body complex protein FliE [candidate division KSB1 bacterium]|nr:MAG: flagellar hook-basal body complex protein FliE [candidate division KSB1 bacterium]
MPSIERLNPAHSLTLRSPQESPVTGLPEEGGSFANTLKTFVSGVNDMQLTSVDKSQKFATGEIKDLHEVMAAAEEAGISLQLLIELRNKTVEAYRELVRIPV